VWEPTRPDTTPLALGPDAGEVRSVAGLPEGRVVIHGGRRVDPNLRCRSIAVTTTVACAEAHLWTSVQPADLPETGAAVAAHPEVAFCAATTGPTNLLISAVCRDTRDLYRYLTERLGALSAIGEIQTAPVVRTVKRASRRP
jgi:DNA-binding Lrp family transcriptional regulator